MISERPWWQQAVFYEVWVRSFFDSNGDGVGDLQGLLTKLDHVDTLGAEAVWLSPIFPSPWADAGYDISDFRGVDPRLGTLEHFDRLVEEAHRRGIRIVLDWPINHTSDQHRWFEEARSGRDARYRDWYVWADPKPDGAPPNNWLSVFGGSAWTLDEETGQYYFHAFLPQQPDLNWRNPAVRTAMHDAMRFWLARGVDGFRVDAVDMLLENPDLPDNPPNPRFEPGGPPDAAVFQAHNRSQPGLHEHIAALRRICDEFGDRVLIGEVYTSLDNLVSYYGTSARPELHLPLNPELLLRQQWNAEEVARTIARYLDVVSSHGWPSWAWTNHDFHRLGSRATPDELRVAAMLLLTLRGTPFIYYGEELGMRDVWVPPELVEDPQGRTQPSRNRDSARTPMQWNDRSQAGFTNGTPYFPVADDYRRINVASQERDPRSLLILHRRLITLRRAEPALREGLQTQLQRRGELLFFRRELQDRCLVVLNMSGGDQLFTFRELGSDARVLLSTSLDRDDECCRQEVRLRGHEGLIMRLT